jgi:2-dehydropantoate 2-reductase
MKIQKVALLGAGAVGAYFIWGFCEKLAENFCVIAEGERKERLQKNGVVINHKRYYFQVKTPQEAGAQDLVLIATKYGAISEAVALLPPLLHKETIVLSLLNGVDSEEKIGAAIGREHMLYSLMRIASKRDDEGIVFDPEVTYGLVFGEKDTDEPTARTEAVEDFLKKSNKDNEHIINYHFAPDITEQMWYKYASNIANNLPQAVLGVSVGAYLDSSHAAFLADKLWNEVYMVAKAKNIRLPRETNIFTEVPKNSRFSTLQDIEAGRHTEIEMFAGEMIRMGHDCGVDVPYCEYTYHAIKALEEKNDGLIG